MKDLIIIGASGFGREVAWLIERINVINSTWNIIGFLDDNSDIENSVVGGYRVLGDCSKAHDYPDAYYVCAVGATKVRSEIISRIAKAVPSPRFASLIDPSVIISSRVTLGTGCIICAGSIITVDINIGNHVIINLDCTIGHDANLHDFVTLFPSVNVSGNVNICEYCEIGTGVQIIQGRTIGSDTIVGAGAVVVKDLQPLCTAVGIPAKPVKFRG